jgi:Domain of unknown function (DUF4136)
MKIIKNMETHKPLLVVILLVLCLSSATSSLAIDVKTDFDRKTGFGRYKTFCWQKVKTRNPLWIERIKAAVGSALTAKGWSQVESGSACDVAVVAMEIKRNHDTVKTFYDDIGGGWGDWGWRGFGGGGLGESTTTTETFQTGTLIVDLFDARSKNLVWRGSATDTLFKNSDKNIKKFKSSVHKLFEHFPPQQLSSGCCSAAECAAHHHEAIEGF